jgi:hypothetical protein
MEYALHLRTEHNVCGWHRDFIGRLVFCYLEADTHEMPDGCICSKSGFEPGIGPDGL